MEIEKQFLYKSRNRGEPWIGNFILIRCRSTGGLYWAWKEGIRPCPISEKPEDIPDITARAMWESINDYLACFPYEEYKL